MEPDELTRATAGLEYRRRAAEAALGLLERQEEVLSMLIDFTSDNATGTLTYASRSLIDCADRLRQDVRTFVRRAAGRLDDDIPF